MGLDEKGRLSLGPQSQVKKLHFERGGDVDSTPDFGRHFWS